MKIYKNDLIALKPFLILWFSQTLSTLGSSMTSYALLLWVYKQKQTTLGVALLALFTYMPSVIISLFAGTFVDRHSKKKIILVCDSLAGLCTLTICSLMHLNILQIWHIYVINIFISTMNAFQTPADLVMTSKLVPKEYYLKISGLQSISSSAIGILTPALSTVFITFFGIYSIFMIDLLSFIIAFVIMLKYITLPNETLTTTPAAGIKGYLQDYKDGFIFLKEHAALLHLILFFTAINLVAYIGGGGITTTVTALIFKRVQNGEIVLGLFTSAVALGTLCGGFMVTFMKSPKNPIRTIFISCGLSFFICDLSLALSCNPTIWIVANFIGNLPLAILTANMTAIMRRTVPIALQGRVFSARDTLQYSTIPISYLLGGLLADYCFEPFMNKSGPLQNALSAMVGTGPGSGIALMFVITGSLGTLICLLGLKHKKFRELH